MKATVLTKVDLRREAQLVVARRRARDIAAFLGFDRQDQVRIATTVSEIARNALRYAGGGVVEFRLGRDDGRDFFEIEVGDTGPGIPDLEAVLEGRYRSETGMGIGLIGTRRLMDAFEVKTSGDGTRVRFGKWLPAPLSEPLPRTAARIALELSREQPADRFSEMGDQDRELLATLAELHRRQSELSELNQELGETNRGVVALYAELDDRAREVQRIADIKSRFLSNITHEFRTPLNSILSLSRLLLDKVDGDLNPEQEKQIRFLHKAARDLADLTNDLLDLAKVESGKIAVQIAPVDIGELFAALRGMLKPMLGAQPTVSLVFEDTAGLPRIDTDERKLAQILRNLLANSLKFTEQGEVRVSARLTDDRVAFTVSDTGPGIAEEYHERIFEEFFQVEGAHQQKAKGTGLGLPIARKFAELLGGSLTLGSSPGQGASFRVELPVRTRGEPRAPGWAEPGHPVVLVHPDTATLSALGGMLHGTEFQPVFARGYEEGLEIVQRLRPAALVVVDPAHATLAGRATGSGPAVPVVLLGDRPPNAPHAACCPDATAPGRLAETLRKHTGPRPDVLVIDDEESVRYVLRRVLEGLSIAPREATDGPAGLAAAARKPDLVILDMVMPGLDGLELLHRLDEDVPVIVYSSKGLSAGDAAFVRTRAAAVIAKDEAGLRALPDAIRDVLSRSRSSAAGKGVPT